MSKIYKAYQFKVSHSYTLCASCSTFLDAEYEVFDELCHHCWFNTYAVVCGRCGALTCHPADKTSEHQCKTQ